MKPIDFRTFTFASLQAQIAGARAAVFSAWRTHGPCTTQQLAERSGLSILSLRPRTTELFQLGFIILDEVDPGRGAGRYRVRTDQELRRWFSLQQSAAGPLQEELALRVN